MEKKSKSASWPDDLLVTKLNIPSPHFKVLRRDRLTKQISPEMNMPIISVVAPAGYGKTTFISDSLEKLIEHNWKVVWLSLDGQDNSPVRFWSYILAGITRETSITISGGRFLQQADSSLFSQALTPMINAIAEWREPLVIVLDDYHTIHDDMIHQGVSYLVNHLPDNLHIIFSSRKQIPFSLFRLKTERRLLEVTADDLAFTLSETDHFLNSTMELAVDPEQVGTLYQMTEGWIVALQLLAISIHGNTGSHTFTRQVSTSRRQLSEYLLNDVLEQQPEPVRNFLIQSSVLSELSPEFCDAVLERHDSQDMLASILDANLFIVSLDNEQKWFRYHPLFGLALQEKLKQASPGLCKIIYLRAYQWLKQHGYSFKAVSYAIAAEEFEQAAAIIEECALQAIIRSDTISLVRWINQISHEIKINRPELILYNVLAALLMGQMDRVQPDLDMLEGIMRSNPNLQMDAARRGLIEWKIRVIKTVMSSWKGYFVKEIPSIEALIASAPEVEPYYLGFLNNSLAEAYGLSENLEASKACFYRTMEFSYRNGLYDEYINSNCEIGRVLEIQGRIGDASKLYARTLEEAVAAEAKIESIAFLKSGLLSVELIHHNLAAAGRLAAELAKIYVDDFSHGFPWIYQAIILVRLASYYLTIGEVENALPYVEWVNTRLSSDKWSGGKMVEGIVHLQADIWLSAKRYHVVQNWLNDRITDNDRCGIQSTDEKLMLARLYLDQNKPRSATPILSELETYLKERGMVYPQVKVSIMQAVAYRQLSNREKAGQYLGKAINLAAPERIIHPFIWLKESVKKLLIEMMEQSTTGSPQTFGAEILALMDDSAHTVTVRDEVSPRKSTLKHILTDRELIIFDQLLDGKSEKDIAQANMISINTVKAHVRNIYKKLNIHNRREAHKWFNEG